MEIHPERPEDIRAIAAVTEAAFGRRAEVRLVAALRSSDGFVPELSLVALDGRDVIGHAMLTYVSVEGSDRRLLELAPLSVLPARQGEGIGSALVRASLAAADELGQPLVLVLGHPGYYPRFGFRPAADLGLEPPAGIPPEPFMAVPLRGYDGAVRGRVVFPPAFQAE
jgi:putative acetyltransferase